MQWAIANRILGLIIAAKAKQFFEMLGLEGTFDALSRWMTQFKQCHGIKKVGLHGEKLSCDKQVAENFKTEFIKFLQSQEISHELVYNTHESGLFWKCLPTCTLAF